MALEYILVDLGIVRDRGLIEQAVESQREKINDDDTTSFTWLTLDELAESGAVIAGRVALTPWQLKRTPAWYVAKCEALSVADWRAQITDDESLGQLNFWHAICWSLRWPQGWREWDDE